jgi:hypothetical protein
MNASSKPFLSHHVKAYCDCDALNNLVRIAHGKKAKARFVETYMYETEANADDACIHCGYTVMWSKGDPNIKLELFDKRLYPHSDERADKWTQRTGGNK